jgi:hypothetical protein
MQAPEIVSWLVIIPQHFEYNVVQLRLKMSCVQSKVIAGGSEHLRKDQNPWQTPQYDFNRECRSGDDDSFQRIHCVSHYRRGCLTLGHREASGESNHVVQQCSATSACTSFGFPHRSFCSSLTLSQALIVHTNMATVQHVDQILQVDRSPVANEYFERNAPFIFEKDQTQAKVEVCCLSASDLSLYDRNASRIVSEDPTSTTDQVDCKQSYQDVSAGPRERQVVDLDLNKMGLIVRVRSCTHISLTY